MIKNKLINQTNANEIAKEKGLQGVDQGKEEVTEVD